MPDTGGLTDFQTRRHAGVPVAARKGSGGVRRSRYTNKKGRLGALLSERFRLRSACVFLAELVDATTRVDDLLLARVERMAVRAHLDLQIVTERRARDERVATAARHRRLLVLRMDARLHCPVRVVERPPPKKGAQCSDASGGLQEKICRAVCGSFPYDCYPQTLWISVWMSGKRGICKGYKNVTSSLCSKIRQVFSP